MSNTTIRVRNSITHALDPIFIDYFSQQGALYTSAVAAQEHSIVHTYPPEAALFTYLHLSTTQVKATQHSQSSAPNAYALAFRANLIALGLDIPPVLQKALPYVPKEQLMRMLVQFTQWFAPFGAQHVSMRPLFANFPHFNSQEQAQLHLLQTLHYQQNLSTGNGANNNTTPSESLDFAQHVHLMARQSGQLGKPSSPALGSHEEGTVTAPIKVASLRLVDDEHLFALIEQWIGSKSPMNDQKVLLLPALIALCLQLDSSRTHLALRTTLEHANHKENALLGAAVVHFIGTHSAHPELVDLATQRLDTPVDVLRFYRIYSALHQEVQKLVGKHSPMLASKTNSGNPNHTDWISILIQLSNNYTVATVVQKAKTLYSPQRLSSLSRGTRRTLLDVLDKHAQRQPVQQLENLFAHREAFLRLFEQLHPGQYATRYPNIYSHSQALIHNQKPTHFMAAFDTQKHHDAHQALASMTQRPGTFGRHTIALLKALLWDRALQDSEPHKVKQLLDTKLQAHLAVFAQTASYMTTPLLLQLDAQLHHLMHLDASALAQLWSGKAVQSFLPKAGLGRPFLKTFDSQGQLVVPKSKKVIIPKKAPPPSTYAPVPGPALQNALQSALATLIHSNSNVGSASSNTPPQTATSQPLTASTTDPQTSLTDAPDSKAIAPASSSPVWSASEKQQWIHTHFSTLQQQLGALSALCTQALLERFKNLEPLGRCYIDPTLSDISVPFAMRQTALPRQALPIGSALPLGHSDSSNSTDVVRLFLYWSERGMDAQSNPIDVGRTDIDLTCLMLNDQFEQIDYVSFYQLTSADGAVQHSGDIVSAPLGGSEFIDIDVQNLNPDVRYIAMCINTFSGSTYDAIPQCFTGIQINPSDRLVDPSRIALKMDLTANATTCMPAFFDIKTRKLHLADTILPKASGSDIAFTLSKTTSATVQALTLLQRPRLERLFDLHVQARSGTRVLDPKEATHLFVLDSLPYTNLKLPQHCISAYDHSSIEKLFLPQAQIPEANHLKKSPIAPK